MIQYSRNALAVQSLRKHAPEVRVSVVLIKFGPGRKILRKGVPSRPFGRSGLLENDLSAVVGYPFMPGTEYEYQPEDSGNEIFLLRLGL